MYIVSGIGAVVKVVGSHLCGCGSIPGKSRSFLIVSFNKGLSLCFMCSDHHVKYWMPRGFLLTSSLLLDYHVKQYIHTYMYFIYSIWYMYVVIRPKQSMSLNLYQRVIQICPTLLLNINYVSGYNTYLFIIKTRSFSLSLQTVAICAAMFPLQRFICACIKPAFLGFFSSHHS